MPIVIKNRRSGTGGQAWPSDLEPGQVALNSADRQLGAGDANGTAGAATLRELLAITQFNSSGAYVLDDMVVYQGDIYVANTTHTGSWDPAAFDIILNPPLVFAWPTELEDNRVGYGWALDAADGLVLNRDPDAAIRFISDATTGKSGFQFGEPADMAAGAIEWDAAANELYFRVGTTDVMSVGDTYASFDVPIRVPDGVIQDNRGGYRFDIGGPSSQFYNDGGLIYQRANGDEVLKFGETGFFCGDRDYEPDFWVIDGDVNAPGLAFGSNPGKGAYRVGTNHWGFTVNGQLNLSVTSSEARCAVDMEMDGTNFVHFLSNGDATLISLEPTYAKIGYEESGNFGDLSGTCTRYRGLEDHGISYVRTDNVHLFSLSVYGSGFANTGVGQLRHSLWVGTDNPPRLGDEPKFVHMESSVSRSYDLADSTEFVLERSGDCYLSVIGTGNVGVKLGNAATEDAFDIVTPSGMMSMRVQGDDMLQVEGSGNSVNVGSVTSAASVYADRFLVPTSVQELASLVRDLQALDARITAAGG